MNHVLLAEQARTIPFNVWELLFVGLYLSSLIVIGAIGLKAREKKTLRDFYLAGRGVGFLVLVLTLYATQYSGNTLFAFSGKTYRIGLPWIMCLHFMTAIVVFYLTFAPKLFAVAKREGLVTPPDYIQFRFRNRMLTTLVSIIMIVAIGNFLVAQLMAMGRALQGITDWDPYWAYVIGVIVLAGVVTIYETLGGFRAVAWTDMIQGSVLMVGFILLLIVIVNHYGPFDQAIEAIKAQDVEPDPIWKVEAPDQNRMIEWYSYILFVGIGGALYPQAIQRIYAAKSWNSLRSSLATMAFLPLFTTVVVVLVGLYGIAYHPGLDKAGSDSVLTVVCRDIQQSSMIGRIIICVLFAAILAALMSTADSVLLSISSMFTKDIYAVWIAPDANEAQLTRVGKWFSWIVIGVAVAVAITLYEGQSLVQLLDKKFDLLVQLAPAFMIGVNSRRIETRAVLMGLIAGLVIALWIGFGTSTGKPFGVHAGLYGLVANLAVVALFQAMSAQSKQAPVQKNTE